MNFDKIGEPGSHKSLTETISLNALRCFAAAAREESFTRAAACLHLTHGAVSRAVRLLEEELAVELFERRNRRVFLSPAGQKLFVAVREGLERIEGALRELRDMGSGGPALKISCEPTLMMRWLIPRLPDFQARHPGLEIQLAAGGGPLSLGRGLDLAIRRSDFDWPANWRAARLFAEKVGPVCREPERLTDLDGAGRRFLKPEACLLHAATRPDAWETWSRLSGVRAVTGAQRSFEHFYFSIQAAVAGLGMAIGPWQLVRDDCAGGILQAPFGFIEDGTAYYLLSLEPFDPQSPAGLFLAWLREQGGERRGDSL